MAKPILPVIQEEKILDAWFRQTKLPDDVDKDAYVQNFKEALAKMGEHYDLPKELQEIDKLPGLSPDTPAKKSLFGDAERASTSFGNAAGVSELLKKKGYTDMVQDEDGNFVVRGSDGRWYRDATDFSENPINAVEANLGKALPGIGMIAGGVGGALAGGGTPATAVTAPLVAGAGGSFGEALRQALGRYYGTYKGDVETHADDLTKEFMNSSLAEGGGRLVGALPIGKLPGAQKLIPGVRNVDDALATAFETSKDKFKTLGAKISGLLSGAGEKAARRTIERPAEVMAATEKGFEKKVAKKAEEELSDTIKTKGKSVEYWKNKFYADHGDDVVGTQDLIDLNNRLLYEKPVNEAGRGGLSELEIKDRRRLNDMDFKRTTIDPQPHPEATSSKPVFGAPYEVAPEVTYTPIKFEPDFASGTKIVPGGEPATVLPAQVRQDQIGFENIVPEQTFNNLRGTNDWLDVQVGKYFERNPHATRANPVTDHYKLLRGKLKEKMHAKSPELAGADAAYNQAKKDQRIVGALGKEGSQESFVSNIWGKNKTAQQQAMERVIPQTFENEIKDLGAAQAFKPRDMSPWRIGGYLAGLAGAGGYYLNGDEGRRDPYGTAMILAATSLLNPAVQRGVLAYGSRMLAPSMRLTEDQLLPLLMRLNSPWKNLEEKKDGKKEK